VPYLGNAHQSSVGCDAEGVPLRNDSFYLASATTIPILLLALTLQGDYLASMMANPLVPFRRALEAGGRPQGRVAVWRLIWRPVAIGAWGFLNVLLAIAAEVAALIVLYRQHSDGLETAIIVAGLWVLLVSIFQGFSVRANDAADAVATSAIESTTNVRSEERRYESRVMRGRRL